MESVRASNIIFDLKRSARRLQDDYFILDTLLLMTASSVCRRKLRNSPSSSNLADVFEETRERVSTKDAIGGVVGSDKSRRSDRELVSCELNDRL
jgi:hypothetical protein